MKTLLHFIIMMETLLNNFSYVQTIYNRLLGLLQYNGYIYYYIIDIEQRRLDVLCTCL